MYLSRLILNPMHRGVQRDLCNCQDLHRTVMSGFPQVPQGMDARAYYSVLYRLESRKNNELSLLVQSRVCPDWSQLPQGYLAADTISENPACKPLEGFLARIKDGAYLMFRLLANPTVRKPIRSEEVGTRNHGRRIAIRNDAARIGWLSSKVSALANRTVWDFCRWPR
jgi:CRISPR system Cascade subunit CasE